MRCLISSVVIYRTFWIIIVQIGMTTKHDAFQRARTPEKLGTDNKTCPDRPKQLKRTVLVSPRPQDREDTPFNSRTDQANPQAPVKANKRPRQSQSESTKTTKVAKSLDDPLKSGANTPRGSSPAPP